MLLNFDFPRTICWRDADKIKKERGYWRWFAEGSTLLDSVNESICQHLVHSCVDSSKSTFSLLADFRLTSCTPTQPYDMLTELMVPRFTILLNLHIGVSSYLLIPFRCYRYFLYHHCTTMRDKVVARGVIDSWLPTDWIAEVLMLVQPPNKSRKGMLPLISVHPAFSHR